MKLRNLSSFFTRPTWIEISKSNLVSNIENIYRYINQNNKKIKLCAIVKSNAYGHGLREVSSVIAKIPQVKYLGITSIEEAAILRDIEIKKPILLLGSIYPFDNFKYLLEYDIIPTVASINLLEELNKFAYKKNVKIKFHLKFDTGMGRIGLSPLSIQQFLDKYNDTKNLVCDGIYSHLSSAYEDKEYSLFQINLFNRIREELVRKGAYLRLSHILNSAGILLYKNSLFDMVRPGLIMYGLLPFVKASDILKVFPVLSLKTRVVFIKTVPKGTYISYSKTFCTKKRTKVATLPIGYADGLMRKLSNRGKVLIKNKFCDIIGRVTMDMMMVDVTNIKDINVGDEVIIIGKLANNKITVEEVANWSETINYEVTTRLSERIPRLLVD
ncbi:MAG: alanine racemase [Endomicrobia bacterium]|nr:alanine racemase [Endomicrobiia bacterium]